MGKTLTRVSKRGQEYTAVVYYLQKFKTIYSI